MSPVVNISVIIPSNHDHHELLNIVRSVCSQTTKPDEIIIVDSSVECGTCPVEIELVCANCGIKLHYEHRKSALPGMARNIGFGMSKGELIAFIDVQTIPRPYWLEASLSLLAGHNADGVFGATCFMAQTRFERLLRDGFYGVSPRRTLPGSVFRRELFNKVGQFIDWARAGEDTEWIMRLEVHKILILHSSNALVDYVGLIGSSIKQMQKRWYRNYSASRDLPHLFPQKLLLWLILYPLIVLIAFNWNYLLADWRIDSPLYIGHVTKMAIILPAFIYLILRGLVLPLHRGVGIWRLLPARFLVITCVCFMGDLVKVLVFSLPKFKIDALVREDVISLGVMEHKLTLNNSGIHKSPALSMPDFNDVADTNSFTTDLDKSLVNSLPTNSKFGWFFAAVFFALAAISYWKEWSIAAVVSMVVAVLFSVATLTAPKALAPLNRLWFGLGLLLGMIVSPIVLGTIFFLMISPIAIFMRIFGRDELKIKKRSVDSYWVERSQPAPASDSFKNQY